MDWHKLQNKLFEMDPTDPREDLAKLQQVAQGGGNENAAPAKDYLRETAEVAEGSLGLDREYSVSDFAALAGVKVNEAGALDALKHGYKNYNKLDALKSKVGGQSQAASKVVPTKTSNPKAAKAAPKNDFPQGEVAGQLYQIKPGDEVGYINKKGDTKVGKVTVMLDTYDSKNRKQIQLKIGTATFGISRGNIRTVNGQPFKLKNVQAGSGTIEALEARVAYLEGVIESLVEGKPKIPKPSNPVAKHMNTFNKASVVPDKKKDAKAGKQKHKDKAYESIKDQLWAALHEVESKRK